jgi:hypothetical protein
LFRRLLAGSPFTAITDRDSELQQLGSIRIATGLLCFARLVVPIWASQFYFEAGQSGLPELTIAGLEALALIGLVTAGVLAPVSTVALLFYTRKYEIALGSDSLSTELLSLLLSLLVVTSAGARRSVDAILMARPGPIGGVVRAMYRLWGIPSANGMRAILTFYFLAIALMNLGGAVNHWFEEAWQRGRAMDIILSSAYMSRTWALWRDLDIRAPEIAAWASWGMTLSQLVMQTTLLVLIWWKPTARLVILWGILFFASSILALQLHYLGAFELLIWMAIFHRPRPSPTPALASFVRSPRTERILAAAGTAYLLTFVAHEAWAFAGTRPYPFPQLRLYIDTIGLHSPLVFNHNDLPLGDVWSVVYRGERADRLPYHGDEGERLAWTHWNDLLLYRSSVRWRNEYNPDTFLDPARDSIARLVQLLQFDHRRRGASVSTYIVDYYTEPASHTELPVTARFARRHVGTSRFHCAGEHNEVRCGLVSAGRTQEARAQ